MGAERRRGDDGAGGTGRGSEGDRGLRVGGGGGDLGEEDDGVREEIGRGRVGVTNVRQGRGGGLRRGSRTEAGRRWRWRDGARERGGSRAARCVRVCAAAGGERRGERGSGQSVVRARVRKLVRAAGP